VAKKKNIKNAAQKAVKQEESMKSKVEIKSPDKDRQEKMSRIVGSIFIGLGVLLVAFGIYSFIRFREEPALDINLEAPTLNEVTPLTNGETITIRGTAQDFDDVFIYVNDTKIASVKVEDDDTFSYEYTVDKEGEYIISAAGVKGFPNRVIGPRSDIRSSIVDRTDPNPENFTFVYGEETNKDTFIVAGNAEPLSTITVKRGTESYSAVADSEGKYRIEGITLDDGKNVFTVSAKDQAGNEIVLDDKIRVTYSPTGDINGDAVAGVSDDIPQAAGELDTLIGNQLMILFGVLAVIAFGTSYAYSYRKNR
jgi:hypothetical protein